MKKNKSKKNNKNIIKLVIILAITIAIIIAALVLFNNENSDAIKFKKEYEILNNKKTETGKTIREINIPKDNPMVYSTASKIADMIDNKETFVVYFGFNECPWCRSVIPSLIEAANDLGLDKIYYVDVLDIRDTMELDDDGNVNVTKKGSKGYYKLLERLSDVLSDYTLTDEDGNSILTGEKRIYAPNVIAVVNGKAEKNEEGISDSQTDGYMKLTKKMKKESYNKFKCLIKCVTESNKTCSPKSGC